MKLLTRLAAFTKLQLELSKHSQVLFGHLQEISQTVEHLQMYRNEVETALCQCLDRISKAPSDKMMFTGQSAEAQWEQISMMQEDEVKLFNG